MYCAATVIQFIEVIRVSVAEGFASPAIVQPGTMLEYNGAEWEYYAFVWPDFFETVWPKVCIGLS